MKPINEIEIDTPYWLVTELNQIDQFEFEGDGIDKQFYDCGNFYLDRAEAEAKANANQVIVDLSRCEGARKFKPDNENWLAFLVTDNLQMLIIFDYMSYCANASLYTYFNDEEELKSAITKVGEERILKALRYLELGEY